MKYAPITLFVYNRPEHTKKTIEHLMENAEFAESHFYVFSDGPINDGGMSLIYAVRDIVRSFNLNNLVLVERKKNYGLVKSITAGVTELCKRYGRVIVLEDDLVVSPYFLNYMNQALDLYVDEPKVMQVSGYMFPVSVLVETDAVFLPISTSWGWATWNRAWMKFDSIGANIEKLMSDKSLQRKFDLDGAYPCYQMLIRQQRGWDNSWAIRFYFTCFMNHGLVLYPVETLVFNNGFDGSGSNCDQQSPQQMNVALCSRKLEIFPPISQDDATLETVKNYLSRQNSVLARATRKILRLFSTKWK